MNVLQVSPESLSPANTTNLALSAGSGADTRATVGIVISENKNKIFKRLQILLSNHSQRTCRDLHIHQSPSLDNRNQLSSHPSLPHTETKSQSQKINGVLNSTNIVLTYLKQCRAIREIGGETEMTVFV